MRITLLQAPGATSEVENLRRFVVNLGVNIMVSIADLRSKVTANTAAVNDAIAQLQSLRALLEAASAPNVDDQNSLQAMSDELDSVKASLTAALSTSDAPAQAAPVPVDPPVLTTPIPVTSGTPASAPAA